MNATEEERDLTEFDKNVMEFFDICKKILNTSEKRSIISNRKNPFLVRLEKYEKTYGKTDPEEHTNYFEKIYNNNKRFILLGPQRDSWLNDSNLVISFGEDCGLKTDIKLHLSAIYNTSCKTRDEIRDEIEGLPNASDTIETTYPVKYMYLLYKIFREIAHSENEKEKLSTHISDLGDKIGIQKKSSNDPMSGLFDMAANMAEQVSGKKMPRDKMPGQNDFGKMISTVMDNPKTKSMLGNVMQEFQNSNNIGDIVTKLVGSLGGGGGESQDNVESNEQSPTIEDASDLPDFEEGDVNDEFDE